MLPPIRINAPSPFTLVRLVATAAALALTLLLVPARAQPAAPEHAASGSGSDHDTTTAATAPPAQSRLTRPTGASVGLYSGVGYLGINDVNGGAILGGVRVGVGRHLAMGFDLGYGIVAASSAVQDRWWLMPSVAFVVPAGRARIDLGIGFGLGSTSGYDSWKTYIAAPFDPVWAFQLVPTGRLHAEVLLPASTRVDLFGRIETAMLFGAGTVGFREGDANRPLSDVTWTALWLGAHYRVL